MIRTAVIMAGGTGERFWPLSRRKRPKQLLNLVHEDKTMLEDTIDRISGLINPEDIYIITSNLLMEPIRKALPGLPPENVIAEPFKRNTAPCLALAASVIASKYSEHGYKPSDISISVLTADQDIYPTEDFIQTISEILDYVEFHDKLATIGIKPLRPETGYGYIEISKEANGNGGRIHPVLKFHEKPDHTKAEEYVKEGNYFWNSGMFFWRLDTFIDSMTKCLPSVGNQISEMSNRFIGKSHIPLPEHLHTIEDIFEAFPNISIDYGLMEKADNVVVAKASFNWDDIGSWDSVARIRESDSHGNVIAGKVVLTDSKDSIVINESDGKIMTSVLGVEGLVVVVTEDALLICPKDRVQEIRKSVDKIRNEYGDKWL